MTYLVQILLPLTGTPSASAVYEDLARDLTGRFGGVTSYLRAPAEGRWKTASRVEQDEITVVEVMVDTIDHNYWTDVRSHLEAALNQSQVVIRAQGVTLL